MSLSEGAPDPKSDPPPRVQAGTFEARTSRPSSASIDAAMDAIAPIDLAAVKRKVVEEKGWSLKTADYAELRYRRFLCMHRLNRELALVPLPDIDAFWHQHILFTREYTRDCEKAFGEYLHHSPSEGTTDDADKLRQEFVETARFYAAAFGENYLAVEPEGVSASWLELFN